ncbi:MAG: hypothetical protein JW751_02090 [Polyangiaceae bacterium]|nr:hypothetical protein [Polyangiaceae bacterium]
MLADWLSSNFNLLQERLAERRRTEGDERSEEVLREANAALVRAAIAGLRGGVDWAALGELRVPDALDWGTVPSAITPMNRILLAWHPP